MRSSTPTRVTSRSPSWRSSPRSSPRRCSGTGSCAPPARLGRPGLGARLLAAFPDEAMVRLRSSMPGTFALSVTNHAFILLVNVLLARGLGIAAPWTALAAAVPLVLLAAQIPITPGGTGLREAAYLYF